MKIIKHIVLSIILAFYGCSNKTEKKSKKTNQTSYQTEVDTKTKKLEGGYGFENIADSLGYVSYTWDEKNDKNF